MQLQRINLFQHTAKRLRRHGVEQSQAFQCFITGGITGLSGMGTLMLLDQRSVTLSSELLALIAIMVALIGLGMAILGYGALLILRLTHPASGQGFEESSNDKPA